MNREEALVRLRGGGWTLPALSPPPPPARARPRLLMAYVMRVNLSVAIATMGLDGADV